MKRVGVVRNAVRALAAGMVLAALKGCGPEKITVVKQPMFEVTTIRKVAVLSFADAQGMQGSGEIVSDMLAACLVQNKQWEIFNRQQLSQILQEQNLGMTDRFDPATAARIGKLAVVDTVLIGRVNQYVVQTRSETKYNSVPIWRTNANGILYIAGYNNVPYQFTRSDSTVSATINLVNVETGKVIWSDTQSHSYWAQGSPPAVGPPQVLENAAHAAVNALFLNLVPHRIEVKVPDQSIFTCKDLVGGSWMDRTDRFTDADPKMYVVLALNRDFHKTVVVVRINKKDQPAVLKQFEHPWDAEKYGSFGFTLSPKELLDQGGPGTYEARYFVSGTEIRKVEFSINPVKKK